MNIDRYMELFIHRGDVFAQQHETGAYFPVRQPITPDDVEEHLAGFASYGVYVIDPAQDNTVRYVVFDLDTHDEAAQAHLVSCASDLIESLDTNLWEPGRCLLLEWSGNKGIHVWLFFDGPVPAAKVRRWIKRDFMPQWNVEALENRWPLEVFPKQDTVDEGGFGNLVKLPLGKHAVSGNFSEIRPLQGWANSVEEVVPLPSGLVPEVPEEGVPRGGVERGRRASGPGSPFPCIDRIMREGVPSGYRDRSMFHLALYCKGHGLDQDIAEEVCLRANEHFDPPMDDAEVRHKVASAYRGRYGGAICGQEWLVDICPGPCKKGWSVGGNAEAGKLWTVTAGGGVEVEVVQVRQEEGRIRVTVKHPDAMNTPTFVCERNRIGHQQPR